jgi:hypothetical protein
MDAPPNRPPRRATEPQLTPTPLTGACSACIYWESMDGMTGTCHRHPPQVVTAGQDPHFFVTQSSDWCGDWAPLAR